MSFEWSETPTAPIAVGLHRLDYACWGPPPEEAPTIVMLHEGLGSVGLWRGFPERLSAATGWGVMAYSRAGYGRSSPAELPRPIDYMTREAEDVLGAVLDAVGSRHVVLLGHSDGATIAAIYAGSVSDMRVRGLILMAPHFFAEEGGLVSIDKARQAYETGDLKNRMAKHHDHPEIAFRGWADTWLHPDFRNWNVADNIDHWRIPCLAIQGRDDEYGTLAQITEIEERIYSPVEKVVLDNCGHAPHVDQPEQALEAIAEFCERLRRLEEESVALA